MPLGRTSCTPAYGLCFYIYIDLFLNSGNIFSFFCGSKLILIVFFLSNTSDWGECFIKPKSSVWTLNLSFFLPLNQNTLNSKPKLSFHYKKIIISSLFYTRSFLLNGYLAFVFSLMSFSCKKNNILLMDCLRYLLIDVCLYPKNLIEGFIKFAQPRNKK